MNNRFQSRDPYSPALADSFPPEFPAGAIITGILSTAKSGTGFIKVTTKDDEVLAEFIIPRDHLNHAFNGDTVQAVIADTLFFDKPYAKITHILQPGRRTFIGFLSKGPQDSFFFNADEGKMYTDVFIPQRLAQEATIGNKVQIEVTEWKDGQRNPIGKVLQIFGQRGEHEAEMKSILAARGIDYTFPNEVEDESKKIDARASEMFKDAENDTHRRDIRHIDTFTIDPVDAKDFDDALSLVDKNDGTYEIGVHIADVSHYVTPGSSLDSEARKREFSTYLVDRTIPMLPEILSNGLCSLNPNTDRLAFSGIFTMKKDGSVISHWFGKTLIHSNRRFSYEEAQEILDQGHGDFHHEINTLNIIAKKLRADRFTAGAIDFADTEIRFELDNEGKPIRVYQKERFDAHKLVEEFMLLKNKLVAEEVERFKKERAASLPFMYRTHDNPDRERIEALSVFLNAVGFNIPQGGDLASPIIINQIIESAKGTTLEDLVSTEMLRSMAKAKYSTSNPKHFGLGFSYYCHFTSPIRRYPDLIAHRLFNHYLHGKSIKSDEWSQYEAIAQIASEREIEVMDAERESIKLKQVEYLTSRIGEVFDGIISGMSESGFFAEELTTKANGLIRFRTLTDDTYKVDRKKYAAIGSTTGKTYQLGDAVKIKVVKTDTDTKQVDFELVS